MINVLLSNVNVRKTITTSDSLFSLTHLKSTHLKSSHHLKYLDLSHQTHLPSPYHLFKLQMSSDNPLQNPSPFNKIPDEILVNIISHIPHRAIRYYRFFPDITGRHDLFNIALVSRQFQRITEPFIYRDILLNLSPDEPFEFKGESRNNRLIRTLAKCPRLRPFVRAMKVDKQGPRRRHDERAIMSSNVNQLLDLVPNLKELAISPPWPHLILGRFTHLHSLDLGFFLFNPHYWTPDFLREIEKDLSAIITQSLSIPTLRRLRLCYPELGLKVLGDKWPNDSYRASPITTLDVFAGATHDLFASPRSGNSLDFLADMLLAIDALEQLSFRVSPDWSVGTIARVIQPHASTLVTLIISTNCFEPHLPGTLLMNSLPTFTRLKRLGIPETFLAHPSSTTFHHLLPPHLECLQVQYHAYSAESPHNGWLAELKRMERLAETKVDCLPTLRLVVWWELNSDRLLSRVPGLRPPENLERIRELTDTFERIGVVFKWLKGQNIDDTQFSEMKWDAQDYTRWQA